MFQNNEHVPRAPRRGTSKVCVTTPGEPTPRLRTAAARFGLEARRVELSATRFARADAAARALIGALHAGAKVVLIIGPSGAGKSTVLRALRGRLLDAGVTALQLDRDLPRLPASRRERCSLIDLIPGPVDRALGALARAGLAQATLLGRAPSELSAGQVFRFDLARALLAFGAERGRGGSGRAGVLLVDEFGAALDEPSRMCLAIGLCRLARSPTGPRVVLVTHDEALVAACRPDARLTVDSGGVWTIDEDDSA